MKTLLEAVSKPQIASQYKAWGAASAMCNIGKNAVPPTAG
jgi:hypothetical protein